GQLGFLDHPAMRRQAEQHLRDLRVNVKSIRQTVDQLSGGQRQSVAVARAVSWGKDIIILDEPTAALGVAQAGMVLELILRVQQGWRAAHRRPSSIRPAPLRAPRPRRWVRRHRHGAWVWKTWAACGRCWSSW